MKVTFPKKRKPIEFAKETQACIVICQWRDGTWGIADFWGLPYAANCYSKAVKLKKAICDKAGTGKNWWKTQNFAIAKITF